MDELETNLLDAWWIVKEKCERDPDELARRIARRRLKTLKRPMRGWCCAIRAADLRITPAHTIITPEEACYPGRRDLWREHVVTLNADVVRLLCAPVELPYCMDWKKAAAKLGCNKNNLVNAINKGRLHVYHIKGIGGQRGKPIPMVWADYPIDPNAGHVCERVHPIYGSLWESFDTLFPQDFSQQITRVPRLRPAYHHTVHRGWCWICPGCKRAVNMLYYPFKKMSFADFFGWKFSDQEWDEVPPPPPVFACVKCHGVRHFSGIDHSSWNEFVHHLSSGLLYGFEVTPPAWFKPERKKAYRPQINRAPSERRAEVLERLLKGWRYKAIMKDLGIARSTLRNKVQSIYAQHRVHSRAELIRLYARQTGSESTPVLSRGHEGREASDRVQNSLHLRKSAGMPQNCGPTTRF